MRTKSAVGRRRELPTEEDSLKETGGFISSIPALEKAESLGPELVAFIHDVLKLDCVQEGAKKRLSDLLERHSAL